MKHAFHSNIYNDMNGASGDRDHSSSDIHLSSTSILCSLTEKVFISLT